MTRCFINRLIDKYLIYAVYKPIYMYGLHATTSRENWLASYNLWFVIGKCHLMLPTGKPIHWLLFRLVLLSPSRQTLPWYLTEGHNLFLPYPSKFVVFPIQFYVYLCVLFYTAENGLLWPKHVAECWYICVYIYIYIYIYMMWCSVVFVWCGVMCVCICVCVWCVVCGVCVCVCVQNLQFFITFRALCYICSCYVTPYLNNYEYSDASSNNVY